MTGIDFPILNDSLILHQPTILEISYMGEEVFFEGVQYLCINKSLYGDLEADLSGITNFYLFTQVFSQEELKDKKKLVQQVLQMIFPLYSVMLTPQSILLNRDGQSQIIDETNFDEFQSILSSMLCLQQNGLQAFNPKSKKAREIAQKLQRARERTALAKKRQEGGSGSTFAQYLSVLTVALGSMSLKQLSELTIYQLYDLIERYSLYINWDLDIRSRLAGAKGEKPIDNWMKNIH